jgi:16S rRNA (cytosine967-C5)-methyltransferase
MNAPVDRPRIAAFDVLRAVDSRDAYANLLLPDQLRRAGIAGRDAAFATELTYGTLRRVGTYDEIASACSSRPWAEVDPAVRDVIRLGCHQILAMDVPTHAAVSTSVELARNQSPRASGFVNAVLRAVAGRSWDDWVDALLQQRPGSDLMDELALRYAHPRWIVERFAEALGPRRADELSALLKADNRPPQITLVARPGRATVAELVEAGAQPGRWSPLAAAWPGGDPASLTAIREHRAGVQDEGSQLVTLALTAVPVAGAESRWLDMCAGPGGKAALLAALAPDAAVSLAAWEKRAHRSRLVRRAVGPDVEVSTVDAAAPERLDGPRFDRVLLDAPCSGSGALRRRPEARWRKHPEDLSELVELQQRLLANALELVRPGGVVGYVTCSPFVAETSGVVDAVTAERGDVERLDARRYLPAEMSLGDGPDVQLWPHVHQTDAMFLALLRRV